MRAVTIGQCAGWLHEAAGSRGVVLAGGLEGEAPASRRTLLRIAEGLAQAGVPTLRYDPTGCGDSIDAPGGTDLLPIWRDDLRAAVRFMRQVVGVSEVALVGFRFGALLALELGAELGIERLALLAPVVEGRAHLRDLARTAGGSDAPDLAFSAATIASLRDLDLRRPEACPAREIFVVSPKRVAAVDAFEANLESLGAAVWTSRFVGWDAMTADPLTARVPVETVAATVDWLRRDLPAARRHSPPLPPAMAVIGRGWHEERLLLGAAGDLAGVLTLPSDRAASRVVVALGAGVVPHTGTDARAVALARDLAREGVATLRLDLPGIGDSLSPTPEPANAYAPAQRADLPAVFDMLAARGLSDITLFGLCSGAHHAFHAALEDARVRGLVLVNPLSLAWDRGYALQIGAWQRQRARAAKAALKSARAERTEVGPDIAALAGIALPLARRFARGSLDALKSLSGKAATPAITSPVCKQFQTLAARGTRVAVVFGEKDEGLGDLKAALGPDGLTTLALMGVSRHLLEGADHLVSGRAAWNRVREVMFDVVAEERDDAIEVDTAAA